jgi:peptidoglycan hydrolase CwlO-like protein
MHPIYEELLVAIESQRKEIPMTEEENRNLEEDIENLQKKVREIARDVKL